MQTMKAVLMKGHGGFDQLEYRDDVPIPVPRANEVLIRVLAAAVNNTDINTRTAWYSPSVGDASGWTGTAPIFPRIQGADACGRITAVGPGVNAARIGERVLIEPVFTAPHGEGARIAYFGSECDGAFAQYARAPAVHAHSISSTLSDVELASFPCAYSAALNMLTRLEVAAGETVLVTGASGGVGSAAVQLARQRGANVLAIAGRDKAAAVRSLGASQVHPRDADLVAELGRETVDAVVDVVGGEQFPSLLEVLRRGGRYAVAGAIAGPKVLLDLRTLYLKDLRFFGCTVLGPGVFADLVRHIERGDIRPLIASVHPLRSIIEAQTEFMEKRHTGKIVLIP
jgi:NADPH:quinone reductase-like Zn-dependent oxidoreductase